MDLQQLREQYPVKPYQLVTLDGQLVEVISYPWPEACLIPDTGRARINVRMNPGDPTSMVEVDAARLTALPLCPRCKGEGWLMDSEGEPCPDCTPADGSTIGGTGLVPEPVDPSKETISDDYWDNHAVRCGNCQMEILTRNSIIANNNGLSDTGQSEDEALCGRCAGAEMYRLMDELDKLQGGNDGTR